jgi:EmrB/QacA subfamily drug resistance transporter
VTNAAELTGPPPTAAEQAALNLSPRAKLEILGAILLALFLFALDQTVVGVALPRILTDLHGNELYTWAVTIYLLTSTISGPIYGKLSDLFGRRPVILFAVSLFLIASALCGLSQEMWQFILFRGLQGLGGGAVFPVALAVVADLYTPAERGKYLGLFGAVFGLSSLVGPAIGGILTDNLSWHWIFYVNIPIGIVALVILWRLLPAIKHPDAARHIDYLGAAIFTAAIAPFLIGLTNKQFGEWTDPAVGGLILLGLVFGLIFIFVESRVEEPIVPLHLFRNRSFTISVIAMFFAAFGFFGAILFLPRWFQTVGGASATESGYNILPLLAGLIFSAIASGQIVARTGRYKLLIFGSLVILAFGLWTMTHLEADTPRPVLWLWMLITGLGIGPSFAVFTLVVQNSIPPREVGVGTASLTFFQQIGGTVGLTLAGTVFAQRLVTEIPAQLLGHGVPQQIVAFFQASGSSTINNLIGVGNLHDAILQNTPAQFRPIVEPFVDAIVASIYQAVSISIASTFWVGIVAALLAAVAVLFLKEEPMRETFEVPEVTAAPEGAPA